MDYIDWAERVAGIVASRTVPSGWIVNEAEILDDPQPSDDARLSVAYVIQDLVAMGVVDDWTNQNYISDNQQLRSIRAGASLRDTWPAILRTWLDDRQEAFLIELVRLCHQPGSSSATVAWESADVVWANLGWPPDRHDSLSLAQSLEAIGCVDTRLTLGSPALVRPTYRGIVRATRQLETEWQQRLPTLVDEWETTTVEFKLELGLGKPRRNVEFARDVIGLANTKASGNERYLIIGYDQKTREFSKPLAAGEQQDRLEDILNAYVEPAPSIRLLRVDHPSGVGEVGVLVVIRESSSIPYRLRLGGGKWQTGDTFVRHGSHVEPPTDAELLALVAEGDRARRQVGG
jgi:hypothetical protein